MRLTLVPSRELLLAGLLAITPSVQAVTYSVSITTTALSGTSAQLALDFIDGGSPSNSVSITGFSTDGALGTQTLTGGASGTLPGMVTLTDTDFFNELLADITLGTTVSFLFTPTSNAPDLGSLPDSFSVLLLDPLTNLPLFLTTDPIGADTLGQLDIDGNPGGSLHSYSAPGEEVAITINQVQQSVPEIDTASGTGAISLLLGVLALRRERRRKN